MSDRSEFLIGQMSQWIEDLGRSERLEYLFELEMWLKSFERYFRVSNQPQFPDSGNALALRSFYEEVTLVASAVSSGHSTVHQSRKRGPSQSGTLRQVRGELPACGRRHRSLRRTAASPKQPPSGPHTSARRLRGPVPHPFRADQALARPLCNLSELSAA